MKQVTSRKWGLNFDPRGKAKQNFFTQAKPRISSRLATSSSYLQHYCAASSILMGAFVSPVLPVIDALGGFLSGLHDLNWPLFCMGQRAFYQSRSGFTLEKPRSLDPTALGKRGITQMSWTLEVFEDIQLLIQYLPGDSLDSHHWRGFSGQCWWIQHP
jgi:hypothetical protein